MRGPGRADIVNAGSGETGYSDLIFGKRSTLARNFNFKGAPI
ncbi:unnamed protein product, partial [Staurois parvus]